jgi:hypothetical protein
MVGKIDQTGENLIIAIRFVFLVVEWSYGWVAELWADL